METNRPRYFAGAISAIYMGARVEARPIPKPPTSLYTINAVSPSAKPVPKAERINRTADNIREFLRPHVSASVTESTAPSTQPTKALLMAQPCQVGELEISKKSS